MSRKDKIILPRRHMLQGLGLGVGGVMLSGCDALNENQTFRKILTGAEGLHRGSQRLIIDRSALAREFGEADLSPVFKANGSVTGDTAEYKALKENTFTDWKLKIDGMVAKPLALSLTQLMAMPVREQITRHDCVEGWSAIGKWRGTPLRLLLKAAQISSRARYLVFHCADVFGAYPYYESIDMIDAFHPQTIMAWGMNDKMLPEAHGAPIRLRVERQLGYKHAKFVMRIEATDDLRKFHRGKGGFWEDDADYAWYAGI